MRGKRRLLFCNKAAPLYVRLKVDVRRKQSI
nr:MAG TPA: hypothetical protein [Caudoviricetes sp.]